MSKLKLPQIIGHRGACGYAPENTLESIRTAAEMGCTWVNIDIKMSKDGVPVLLHDPTLERTTNGAGKLIETSYAHLAELEAGSWFAEGFANARIPTLEEAVDEALRLKLGINLELRPDAGKEIDTAEAALDVLSRIWDEPDKLLLSSDSQVSLERAMDMAPEWPRALLMREHLDNFADIATYLKLEALVINGRAASLTRERVEEYIDAGLQVIAYTINDAMQGRKLISWGVDAVLSDAPDVVEGISKTRH